MAADEPERATVRVRSGQRPIRPLPVILPPLTDELLSSWINRHAAFIGVSGMRLLRHYHIDVPTVRDLDLELSRCDASKLAEALRCSPQVLRNMTQSRGGRVRSGLVAIRQPTQICRPCAVRHGANSVTRNARLRSWMEGWRITCPICRTELEDFRLYTRLFRADPADALLMQIKGIAREGEQKIDRSSRRRGGASTYATLMRGLLLPQASRIRPRDIAAGIPRLLDLVSPGCGRLLRAHRAGKLALHVTDAAAQCAHPGACWRRNSVGPPRKLDWQADGCRCAAAPGKSAKLPRGPDVLR